MFVTELKETTGEIGRRKTDCRIPLVNVFSIDEEHEREKVVVVQ